MAMDFGWLNKVVGYNVDDNSNPWGSSPGRSGAGAYGAVPQLPSYTKDISTQVGPDVYGQLTKNLPGYQGMVGASSGNIAANLGGRVSSDVIAQLQQGAAERGISTGTEGSGNNNAAYLKALGLTSMQLQQLGESQLTAAIGRTPIQQMQTGTQQSDLAAQQAIYNAAPNPTMAAGANLSAARAGMGAGFGGGPVAPTSGLGAMGYQSAPPTLPNYFGETTPSDPYAAFAALNIPGLGINSNPYGGGQLAMGPEGYTGYNPAMGGSDYNTYGVDQYDQFPMSFQG